MDCKPYPDAMFEEAQRRETMNKHWDVMNKLEESFSNINSISFMLEELTEAMDNNRMDAAHDIAHALNAFLPVYTDNWDRNFKKAWDQVVKNNETL